MEYRPPDVSYADMDNVGYCGFTLSELLTLMKPDAEKHACWFGSLLSKHLVCMSPT